MLIPIGFFGGASQPKWFGLLKGSGRDYAYGITADSQNNVIAIGSRATASTSWDATVTKFDPAGALLWQRQLNATRDATDEGYRVVTDSSNNIYAFIQAEENGTNFDGDLVKYDPSGTVLWQRRISYNTSLNDGLGGLAVDSSGNVYVALYPWTFAWYNAILMKYNSSGTLQWQRRLFKSNYDVTPTGIAVDSSGNVFMTGYANNNTSWYSTWLAKYNTSGSIQWQRQFGSSGNGFYSNKVATDSSGNVYVSVGSTVSANAISLIKYNTSGVLQWQKQLDNSATSDGPSDIASDASGNTYLVGVNGPAALIAKHDSSGTLQWQRNFTASSPWTLYTQSIALDSAGNFVAAGQLYDGSTGDTLVMKFPTDGGGSGTYSFDSKTFIYAASSLTSTTTSYGEGAAGHDESSGIMDSNNGSLGSITGTQTWSLKTI